MDVCRVHVLAGLLLIGAPAAVLAQGAESQGGQRPLFVIGALYDARSRMTAEGGVIVPFKLGFADQDAVLTECTCLSVTAGAGPGGQRLAIGPTLMMGDGSTPLIWAGLDALFTVLHTSNAPRGAQPNATYLGAEAGITFFFVRFGIGVTHPVSGPAPHHTVVAWNVGFKTVW